MFLLGCPVLLSHTYYWQSPKGGVERVLRQARCNLSKALAREGEDRIPTLCDSRERFIMLSSQHGYDCCGSGQN